jgi:hypothetical protein
MLRQHGESKQSCGEWSCGKTRIVTLVYASRCIGITWVVQKAPKSGQFRQDFAVAPVLAKSAAEVIPT